MTVVNLKDLMKKNSKDDTTNDSDLKKVYNYSIYHEDSITTTEKGFINIDNGSMGGTHWTCFYVKDKSFYFDNFGGYPDKFLLQQLPKPITFHNYKIQDNKSKLCGTYLLYFYYLIERRDYKNAVLKIYFG